MFKLKKYLHIILNLGIFTMTTALLSSTAAAATFSMNPITKTFEIGCERSALIEIDTTGETSNAGEVEISYDPTKIEILDSNPSISGVQIKEGNAYQAYLYNDVNTTTGTIKLAASSFTGSLSSKKTFGEIEFKGKPGAGSTAFTIRFDGIGNTFDSNIADTSTSNDLLTAVTNGSYNFIVGPCAADTTPPSVFFNAPTNGQANFPLNGNVNVRLTDNQSGIDLSTLEFIIDGQTYTTSDTELTYTGSSLDYTFIINPNDDFISGAAGTIRVKGKDNAGNSFNRIITFNQPDTVVVPPNTDQTPPVVVFKNPENLSVNVPEGSTLDINISDTESALDQNSITIVINGDVYTLTDPEVTITENSPSDLDVSIEPRRALLISTYNIVTVEGQDVAANSFNRQAIFNLPDGQYTEEQCQEVYELINETDSENVCEPITEYKVTGSLDGTLLENTFVENIVDTLSPPGAIGLLAALLALSNFAYLLTVPGLLFRMLSFLVSRSSLRTIGVVMESISSKPVPYAVCSLYLKDSEYLVERTLTDGEGRYGFAVAPGEYRLIVHKQGFAKKERLVVITEQETDYSGFNIKLDSLELASGTNTKLWESLKNRLVVFFKKISFTLFVIGFLLALVAVYFAANSWNIAIAAFYILILLANLLKGLLIVKPSSVINSETGLKIPYVIVKIYDTKNWKLVTTEITNSLGKFDINKLDPGEYALSATSAGYAFPSKESKSLIKKGLVKLEKFETGTAKKLSIKMDPINSDDSKQMGTGSQINSPFSG